MRLEFQSPLKQREPAANTMSEAPDAFQQEMTLEEDDGFSRLVEMGFGRAEVVKAMRAAYNNAERAVEYLMTGVPVGAGEAALEPRDGEMRCMRRPFSASVWCLCSVRSGAGIVLCVRKGLMPVKGIACLEACVSWRESACC